MVCADTGCGVSLIDRAWALSKTSTPISKLISPLRVRGVGSSKHETSEYITQDLYFPGTDGKGDKVLACARRELHLVEDLRVKVLIGNDIIGPEGITLDVANKKARIGSCGVTVQISRRRKRRVLSYIKFFPLSALNFMHNSPLQNSTSGGWKSRLHTRERATGLPKIAMESLSQILLFLVPPKTGDAAVFNATSSWV